MSDRTDKYELVRAIDQDFQELVKTCGKFIEYGSDYHGFILSVKTRMEENIQKLRFIIYKECGIT